MNQAVHAVSIAGMTCDGCSSRISRVLESTPGILKAEISHSKGTGKVTTSVEITISTVLHIINSAGFEAHA
ncbi:MAG: heavy-metal-associated domain-containing protein [Candidatus Poseidoniaceae archaeon]|nr:heavy-metal-associated domain-containing protein [Candidatus Poseidoniaceae archaeon]